MAAEGIDRRLCPQTRSASRNVLDSGWSRDCALVPVGLEQAVVFPLPRAIHVVTLLEWVLDRSFPQLNSPRLWRRQQDLGLIFGTHTRMRGKDFLCGIETSVEPHSSVGGEGVVYGALLEEELVLDMFLFARLNASALEARVLYPRPKNA